MDPSGQNVVDLSGGNTYWIGVGARSTAVSVKDQPQEPDMATSTVLCFGQTSFDVVPNVYYVLGGDFLAEFGQIIQ